MAPSTEIAHDFAPFIRVYKDNRVERLVTIPLLPPSTDPITGVQTKDIVISSDPENKSRIFLPKIDHADPPQKLPLIIYVHGGAFCLGSALDIATQSLLTPLVSQTPAVAIAIGYNLAPEHPLPTAYHDCWAAFEWIASHVSGAGPDSWINEYVDMSQVFLAGDSAGGNLVHYLAVQAGINHTGLSIRGLILLHPYFTGEVPEKFMQFLYPGSSGSGVDDPKLNPVSDPDVEKLCCSRVFIATAEHCMLKPRGIQYIDTLKKSKWEGAIQFEETKGEGHCFFLLNPASEKAKDLSQTVISFIKEK